MRRSFGILLGLFTLSLTPSANSFPHIVRKGETLATIAERYYGKLQFERIIATENGLERLGKTALTPGYPLEIPTLRYHRVKSGDTWESLAELYLGTTGRGVFLAQANGSKPWIPPELGTVLVVPHQLVLPLTGEEGLTTLAYRFLGSTKDSFTLASYNDLGSGKLPKGGILYVPIADLPLTEVGKAARDDFSKGLLPKGAEDPRKELALLEQGVLDVARDIRSGRYLQAVARGEPLRAGSLLPENARLKVVRALLTAYVALEARALAQTACKELRELDPTLVLDPVLTSPKERALCPEPDKSAKETAE